MRGRTGRRRSSVEDRRGAPGPAVRLGGGGPRVGGLGLVLVVVALLRSVDPSFLLSGLGPAEPEPRRGDPPAAQDLATRRRAELLSVLLADTEDSWKEPFRHGGASYLEPTLVLSSGATDPPCGFAEAAVGPFRRPGDSEIDLDLELFGELDRRFGAPGDLARA